MVFLNDREIEKLEEILISQIEMLCDDSILVDLEKLNNLIVRNREISELVQSYLNIQRLKIDVDNT